LSHVEQLLHLIVHYGCLIVFFGVMAESAGVPLPGETSLIASASWPSRASWTSGTSSFSAPSGP
jgi:membrane protein DedA with SNARE-associated domain